VHNPPEDGEGHNQENPGKFIGGFFFFVEYMDRYDDTEDIKGPAYIPERPAGADNKKY
jgi:hypothetical protein